jgi:hypothetical protein
MEFKLTNPENENGFIQSIDFNFDELKAELTENLEKYQNLVYTEETIKEAKEVRANLNKLKTAIEDKRKEVKNLIIKPYDEFAEKVKELTALIDQPINAIDTQIKNYDEQRQAAKQIDIQDNYNALIGDLAELLPLDKIFNPKWLNITYKMETISKELAETIGKVKGDLNVIAELKLDSDMELQVKDKYLQTLDFSKAMAEKTRLENLKASYSKYEEQQKEPELTSPQIKPKETKIIKDEISDVSTSEIQTTEPIYYREFYVRGTKEQLTLLGAYLKGNNIEYGSINK